MKKLIILFCIMAAASLPIYAQQDGEEISFGKYRIFYSEILNEDRTLLVSLPDNYLNSNLSYPVLYLLYGDQVKGYYAEAVNVVHRLSNSGEIPPFVIVGIANTDRYRDCLPLKPDGKPGDADKFLGFLKEELNPFLKTNYRIKEFSILAGPQAGAAFCLYSNLEKSDIFNAYILTNPFWTEYTRSYFLERTKNLLASDSYPNKFMFITYWDYEGWQDHRDAVNALQKFFSLFDNQGTSIIPICLNYLPDNKDFIPPIGLKEGLRKYFLNYIPVNYSELNTLSDIKKYYSALSREYGYSVDEPEMLLVRKSDDLQDKGDFVEAREILNYMLLKNPNSLDALFRMANLHRMTGEYDEAITYYDKFLRIRKEPFLEQQLQALLNFKKESAVYVLEPILNTMGIEAMLVKFRELKIDPDHTRVFSEAEFNFWGYRLLQRGEIEKALEVFKLNADLYPESANVYDSLGEA